MRFWLIPLLLLIALPACVVDQAHIKPEQEIELSAKIDDPLAPRNNLEQRFASRLQAATLVTSDLNTSQRFFVDGMGMSITPEVEFNADTRKQLANAWGLEQHPNWKMYYVHRPQVDDEIIVRLIVIDQDTPRLRPDMNATLQGILSLGFSIENAFLHEGQMKGLGIGSRIGVTVMDLPRANEGTYEVGEIHYLGPESTYMLGIARDKDYPPLSTIDAGLGIGGPSYSALIADDPDQMKRFMEDVLGFEARRDLDLTSSGPDGGLGLKVDNPMRFIQMFAPGARAGYTIVMGVDGEVGAVETDQSLAHRGLAMWTFTVPDLAQAQQRASAFGAESRGPYAVSDTVLGSGKSLIVTAPNGQLFEFVEAGANGLMQATEVMTASCDKPVVMIVEGSILDEEKFATYGAALAKSGMYPKTKGYYQLLGDPIYVFEGEYQPQEFVLAARFPCARAAREFWYAQDYQKIKPLREGAGAVRVMVFDELNVPEYIDWK